MPELVNRLVHGEPWWHVEWDTAKKIERGLHSVERRYKLTDQQAMLTLAQLVSMVRRGELKQT